MKNNESQALLLSRRDLLIGAAQAGTVVGLSQLLPNELFSVFAQNVIKGKEKLIVRSVRPEDLETPVGLLNTWVTPNELFYVRHHTNAARPDEQAAKEWKVEVGGEVERPMSVTLDELKRMPKATVTVTLE